ncbi:hypothetical protein TUM4438_23460 [Shewanella sairae]|uniref:Methyltransferase n=1 Tax=Shewanella sairae TaxID=190310 RepID=A0ABQ4PGV6_9GAMM|nr:hypothetical protein [Shewanella sairae]MCL1132502.1 hypothetical protein [Shewanella sairae]GIU46744.1 hypothetical protein TUM4438_23380 [Shewanella sairae]GIU46762.1 hypothetical protein TUM4438_23460 [Shewanella sairae]
MNVLKKVALGSAVAVASSSAFANADITAAITAGEANVALVVAGVIAVTALAFGLGMIKSWLGK